jgi:trans-aconitate methyltransferase
VDDATAHDPSQFYTGIVAEIYAPLRSSVPEVEPYARFIKQSGEPAIELGCGTGDPLLDLRARGLDVEGLDASADMLARCRSAAAVRGLDVMLHHQTMESMTLDRRFRSIFVAGPSFNLLPDDRAATCALSRIRHHLEPGGAALVPLFIPRSTPHDELGRVREHVEPSGRRFRVTTVSESRDDAARWQRAVLRYEIIAGNTAEVVEVVEREWLLRWHTQDGFRDLCAAAGLAITRVCRPDGAPAEPHDHAFVFRLTPRGP